MQQATSSPDAVTPPVTTGYSFTCSLAPPTGWLNVPLPIQLLSRPLVREAIIELVRPAPRPGAVIMSNIDGGAPVRLLTSFNTGLRLVDLSSDHRASFAPLVLDRPAPDHALGRLLEVLQFVPSVLAWDPDVRGSIVETSWRRGGR